MKPGEEKGGTTLRPLCWAESSGTNGAVTYGFPHVILVIDNCKAVANDTTNSNQMNKTRRFLPKIYLYELANLIFELPYCRINGITGRNIAARQTASTYLKDRVRMDVLTEHNLGKEKLFAHPRFIRLLTTESNTWEPFRNQLNSNAPTD